MGLLGALFRGAALAGLLSPAWAASPLHDALFSSGVPRSVLVTGSLLCEGEQNSPEPVDRVGEAMDLLDSGDQDKASVLLETLASSGRSTPTLLLALGRAFLACGQWDRCVTVLEEARRSNRCLADFDYYLGVAYFRVGRDQDAVQMLSRTDFQTVAAREGARFYRGLALVRLGKIVEARSQLRPYRSQSRRGTTDRGSATRGGDSSSAGNGTRTVDRSDPNSILEPRRVRRKKGRSTVRAGPERFLSE